MVDERARGGIEFALSFGGGASPPRPDADTPFAILAIGDLGGRQKALLGRRPMKVDLDTFDAVFERLSPELRIELPGTADAVIAFRSLDDFHPDSLFERLDLFADVRRLRREVRDPAALHRIAAALGLGAPAEAAPSPKPAAETGEAALERLLGRAPSGATAAAVADDFIRKMVAPHIVRGPDPREADVLEALEAAASELMRALMHHPDFQSLESTWRGLDFLVRNLELDDGIELFLLDAPKEALDGGELHRIVVDERVGPSGATPFALIACAHAFAPTAEDADRLAHVGTIARAGGAVFLATAEQDAFLGAASEPFEALRKRPEARAIGLLGPRFLLRLPYGPGMEETERFRFVEQPTPPEPAGFLWGPPAFLAACLLGQSFLESGWGFSPDQNLELGGLPVHTYRHDGEAIQTPCAEVWLASAAAEALLARGVVPVQSVRGRDEVRLARFQSIAEPAAPLLGRFG